MRRGNWENAAAVLFVAALSGAGCGPSREDFEARGRTIEELRAQLDEANRRQEQTQAEVDRLMAENGGLNERVGAMGQLSNDLEEARRMAAEYERRARQQQERLSSFRRMLTQFRAMIDSGRLRVRIVRGRMVIELPSNILFSSGNAELSEQGRQTLSEVAAILQTIENRQFQIVGHTDNEPVRRSRFGSNWQLSTARAVSVVQYLQEQGVTPTSLSAAGYAEYAPTASNDGEEGRAQNRRIEIVLMPNLDELPDLSSLESEVQQPAATN